jgi:hypothetical protein
MDRRWPLALVERTGRSAHHREVAIAIEATRNEKPQ